MKKLRKTMNLPQTINLTKGWNVGGTLHDVTVSEWHRSKWGNGLATCSDFVTRIASLHGEPSIDDPGNQKGIYHSSLVPLKDADLFGLSLQLLQAVTLGTRNHVAHIGDQHITQWVFLAAAKLGWLRVDPLPEAQEVA